MTSVTVTGASAAYLVPTPGTAVRSLEVFDGINWLEINADNSGSAQSLAAAAALLKEFDGS